MLLRGLQRTLLTQPRSAGAAVALADITQAEIVGVTAYDPDATPIGIDGNGYVLRLRTTAIAAATFDLSKIVVTILAPGYTNNGSTISATTNTITVNPLAQLHRQSAAGSPDPTTYELNIRASDSVIVNTPVAGTVYDFFFTLPTYVYSADTVSVSVSSGWYSTAAAGAGPTVTNSSTLTYANYAQPIYGFMNWQRERVEASTYSGVELKVDHRYAQNGTPVAGVELWATDGTNNGATSTILTPTLSTIQTREAIAEVYSANVALTGVNDTDGTTIQKIDGYIYPWRGVRYQISVDGLSGDGAQPCRPLQFIKDTAGKYGGAIAYFRTDGVAGSAPAVGRSLAGTFANAHDTLAYATPALALAAIATYNSNASAPGRPASSIVHNDIGGAKLYAVNGTTGVAATWEFAGAIGQAAGLSWFEFGPAPEANATVSYSQTALRNVPTLVRGVGNCAKTGTAAVLGCNDNTQDNTKYLGWRDGTITLTSGSITPWLRQAGLIHQRNLNYDVAALGVRVASMADEGTSGLRCVHLVGITYATFAATVASTVVPYFCVGLKGRFLFADPDNTTRQTTNDGGMVDNVINLAMTSAPAFIDTAYVINRGFAVTQSVFESIQGLDVSISQSASNTLSKRNVIVAHLTVPCALGDVTADVGRLNHFYNGSTSNKTAKQDAAVMYNLSSRFASKSDYFSFHNSGGVTGNTGNYPVSYNVDARGNVMMMNRVATIDGSDFWRRCIDSLSEGNVGEIGFTDNKSKSAGSAGTDGGGTYTLTGASSEAYSRVASGKAVRKYDIAGVARKNDGTGAAGAYERTL